MARLPVSGKAAIGPMFNGPWYVPVIVERHTTLRPSARISWTSKRMDIEARVEESTAQRHEHLFEMRDEAMPSGSW